MGIAAGSVGLGDLRQERLEKTPPPLTGDATHATDSRGAPDLVAQLQSLKRAYEAGLIDQAEFDAAKAKALGLT